MASELVQHAANALSTIIILSCLVLKVPQILNIKAKKSAEGIFVEALLMEVSSLSVMVLYNYTNRYSMLTYLEYPIILIQVYVLLYYVLKYKKSLSLPIVPAATVLYALLICAFVFNLLPKSILTFLVPLCTPLNGFAKITYIYGMLKAENADAVSISTWLISVSTNFARIFTVYVDSADLNLMFNFFISTLLSLGVMFTALYYQNMCDAPVRENPRRAKRRSNHID